MVVHGDRVDASQWIEEVRSICGKAIPVILVACKVDLRDKAVANGTFSHDHFIDRDTVS
jgi:Rho family protein